MMISHAYISILDIGMTIIAAGYRVTGTKILGRMTSDDINSSQESVCTISDRIRPTDDFDAFDIFYQQWQVGPGNTTEGRNKN